MICAQAADESAIKAAYVYNFAKFVNWPASAFDSRQSPLVLCILGEQEPDDAFQSLLGKAVGERELLVRRPNRQSTYQGCHMVFLGKSEIGYLPALLGSIKDKPILTISDIQDFIELGGMIGLVNVKQRIRFEINLQAAEAANLKISSRLLQLSRNLKK